MTQWRPAGWKNPYAWSGDEPPTAGDDSDDAFEDGADALLKALRANQWCPYDLSVLKANFKGKVVIVPDDEEVKR